MKTSINRSALTLGVAAVLALSGCGESTDSSAQTNGANQQQDHAGHSDRATPKQSADAPGIANYAPAAYPLETCVVAGAKLGSMGKPVTLVHEGREVKFCCAACEPKFEDDPDAYIQKIDQAVVQQQAERYPLDTCVISGDALGDEPVDYVYENRLVRLCCDMCIAPFLNDPAKHLSTLNAAAARAQLADYPAKTCPVSDADLGSMGKPIDMMVGDRLVRLCCDGCNQKVKASPAAMLGKVYGEPKTADAE